MPRSNLIPSAVCTVYIQFLHLYIALKRSGTCALPLRRYTADFLLQVPYNLTKGSTLVGLRNKARLKKIVKYNAE